MGRSDEPSRPTRLSDKELAIAKRNSQEVIVNEVIVVFNAGSTSLKFATYAVDGGATLSALRVGRIDSMQGNPHFAVTDGAGKPLDAHEWGSGNAIEPAAALHHIIGWLKANLPDHEIIAVGHRVVLGGTRFDAPVLIDDDVLDYLDSLAAMEPSHQRCNVAGARASAEAFPGRPQVACFDNSFHRTMPEVARTYALPKDVRDAGVRHWGYHGISYDYISRQMPAFAPTARRVIVAHLGGGASLCALLDGRSVETSMGFSALSGLPMATRSGDVPPGALFYLLRSKRFDDASLEKMLYERSGLLGLSGISGDMRVLQESADPRAAAAIEHFVYAMTKTIGAYSAVLGGLDALVFTGGIGENSAPLRAALCGTLASLGVQSDGPANAAGGPRISTADSSVSVWVIPTDEEWMIAQQTLALIGTRVRA
ncbi:MAG: acetate/propionate family kinase [Rubrivivax sp.]